MWRWAWFWMFVAVAPLAAQPARLALVIGNSTYSGLPPIPACEASSGVVAAALRRAGFAVKQPTNPSNGQMGAAIGAFGDTLAQAPGSAAIIYACGYAVGFEDRIFLLPASARLERETDALTQGLVSRVLTGAIATADLRAGLVLLDMVAMPGGKPFNLSALGLPAGLDTKGLLATDSATIPPDGPTVLASAAAAALAGPNADVGSVLGSIRTALQGSRLDVFAQMPAQEAWLIGGPPPAAAALPPAPTPPPVSAPAPEPPAVTAGPPPAPPATPQEPGTPAQPNEADRRRIQLALQQLGYYDGRIDGRYGPETGAAIRRFQHELGADMTGRLTLDQLSRLLAGK